MPVLSTLGAMSMRAFGFALLSPLSVSYLVVAGGGSGGGAVPFSIGIGGGGDAGQLHAGTRPLATGTAYTITVGPGGLGAVNGAGGNSSIAALVVSTGGPAGLNNTGGGTGGNGSGGPGSGDNGGPPTTSSISGSSLTYAAGGGDGVGLPGGTGPGTGGDGNYGPTGGGDGNDGDPGIVVIRYHGTARATGGTITTVGGDTVHTFTTSGTFTTN